MRIVVLVLRVFTLNSYWTFWDITIHEFIHGPDALRSSRGAIHSATVLRWSFINAPLTHGAHGFRKQEPSE